MQESMRLTNVVYSSSSLQNKLAEARKNVGSRGGVRARARGPARWTVRAMERSISSARVFVISTRAQ